nr:GcrA family cell cycle regulator [Bradyrhizobium tropiciagri]
MNWLPEHSAALQDLRARGLSYWEIADTINATFNTAYTRNAALSRAQRMGLAGLDRARAVSARISRTTQAGPAGAPADRPTAGRAGRAEARSGSMPQDLHRIGGDAPTSLRGGRATAPLIARS